MDEDEMGKEDIQNPADLPSADQQSDAQPVEDIEGDSEPTPLTPDGEGQDLDLGILEPPLPIDDEVFSEPSKLRIFLRRLLRWLVVVLVIFALGVGATWLARVSPQQQEISELENAIEQDLLNFEKLDFGQDVYLSKVYEAIENLEGVDFVNISEFIRDTPAEIYHPDHEEYDMDLAIVSQGIIEIAKYEIPSKGHPNYIRTIMTGGY